MTWQTHAHDLEPSADDHPDGWRFPLCQPDPNTGCDPDVTEFGAGGPIVDSDTRAPCGPWIDPCTLLDCVDGNQQVAYGLAMFATEFLYVRSGRVWPGKCRRQVRPIPPACCHPAGCDQCDNPNELRLPGPVASVERIVVNGQDLDLTGVRIRDSKWLHRAGGWPGSNDITRDPYRFDSRNPGGGGLGTPRTPTARFGPSPAWVVDYHQGADPPPAGQLAAYEYARYQARHLKQCEGGDCPPAGQIVAVDREGVSYALASPTQLAAGRLTAVQLVNDWLTAINPLGAVRPPRVLRPGRRRPRSARVSR